MTTKTAKDKVQAASLQNPSSNQEPDIGVSIKKLLAQHLGVEPEDIKDEDSFVVDLHMRATDLSDFFETLATSVNTSGLDLTEIETVGELIESLSSEEFIG